MQPVILLDYIFKKIGAAAKRRSEILSHIIALYQNGLKSFVRNGVGGRGNKCDCKIEKPVADEFIRLFKTRRATYDKNKFKFDEIIDAVKNNVEILDISTDEGDLEDIFLQVTNR